jgi:DNA-binding transcriptional LysR family regulator
MNLRGIDLNLLVILDALIDERHVSRAATRLGLSQPATSSALERCRQLFGDPLLERADRAMRLTPRAEALREPLRHILAGVEALVAVAPPALADIRQTVHVMMADILGALLARPLVEAIGAVAPGIDLVLHAWRGGREAVARTAKGGIDLIVSVLPPVDPRDFHVETLVDEHYRVAMRADHPAAADFDLDRWLDWPHILISSDGSTHGPLDEALAAIGRERRIALVVPSFMLVPDLLRETDMIAMLPSLCLGDRTAAGLAGFAPPLPIPGFTLHMAWHRRRDRDPAVGLIADRIRRLVRDVPQR